MRFAYGLVMLAAVGCDSQTMGPALPGLVAVGDDYFRPSTVSPDGDGVVTWIWGGMRSHNIVFADGIDDHPFAVASGVHMRDFTGSAPGNYDYACTLHSGMNGRVIVP